MSNSNLNPQTARRQTTMRARRRAIVGSFCDLVFPRNCVVCESEMSNQADLLICQKCLQSMRRTERACEFCSASRKKGEEVQIDDRCGKCRGVKLSISKAMSLGEYEGSLRDTVISMKHTGQDALIFQIGRWLGFDLRGQIVEGEYDLIASMPTHWFRRYTRGVNVAAILAEAVSQEVGLPAYSRLLKQNRATKKQGTLTRPQRFQNVKGSIEVRKEFCVENRKVLLIDDVMTSGATVHEASNALLKAGATQVGVAVVARSVGTF